MIEVLTTNHFEEILNLFGSSQKCIKIISPFLTMSMADILCREVSKKGLECIFITRFYMEDIINKANSIDAIEKMMDNGIEVYAVKCLHTKLYLFDDSDAILGSANFTNGGFKSNIELSVHISDDVALSNELHDYFDGMIDRLREMPESLITKEIIEDAKKRYQDVFLSKKESAYNRNGKMYGAALNKRDNLEKSDEICKELAVCKKESDIVCDMFREFDKVEQKDYPFTVWLKFDGEANDRLCADEHFPMTEVELNGKKLFLSCHSRKVHAVNEDDWIYLAALTTDKRGKNQPIIVGRGILQKFSEENFANEAMIRKYNWMQRYPWYTIIKECEVLNTDVKNGVPMDWVWDELGSDTYISSFGRNEDISSVSKKHYQKAHIRLSGNAKNYIDKKLDELKEKFGVNKYYSDV